MVFVGAIFQPISNRSQVMKRTAIFTALPCAIVLAATVLSHAADLAWLGSNGSDWDAGVTQNWSDGNGGIVFNNGDSVTFDDTASGKSVTVPGAVEPSSIFFDHAAAYNLSGAGTIAGAATLTKSGTGLLTTWVPNNSYSGGTVLNGPLLLKAGAAPATGSYTPLGAGPVTINQGGSLKINPGNGGGNTHTFPNAIVLNGGVLYQEDGVTVISGPVTVSAPSVIQTTYNGKDIKLSGGLFGTEDLTLCDVSI